MTEINPYPEIPDWPVSFQGCTVTGRFIDVKGNPMVGKVHFTPSPKALHVASEDVIIVGKRITVDLDANGAFAITLPATDDPDVNPVGWTYTVFEDFQGGRTYPISAPQNQTVNLASIAPVNFDSGVAIVRGEKGDPGEDGSPYGYTLSVPRESSGVVTDTSKWFTDWYGNGVLGHSLTEKKAGVGSAFITTSTDGLQANYLREFDPLDLSNDTFKVWVKADVWANLVNAQVRLHSTYDDFYLANIKNRVASTALPDNEWIEVHLPRSAFEPIGTPVWETITCLSFAAWSPVGQSATVYFNHVTRHPSKQGVVSITFDDGWASQYEAAAIMDEFGYVGTAYVIHTLLGQPGYLTAAQVDDLHDRGWDIGGHDDAPLRILSDAALDQNLRENAAWLRDKGYRGSAHYAYPNGSVDARVEAAVRRYFATGRTINPTNTPTGNINPYRLGAVSVYNTQDDAEVYAMVDGAVANGEWAIICLHKVDTSGDEIAWTPARFRALLQYIKDAGAVVRPVGAVL